MPDRHAGIDQGSHDHVPACPCKAVEIGGFHSCSSPRRLMRPARYPAPNPLSMFTTAIPGTQVLSMVRSADSPSKLTPYPTLVGTAMTGLSTSPPTTPGRAPSLPATTPRTFA